MIMLTAKLHKKLQQINHKYVYEIFIFHIYINFCTLRMTLYPVSLIEIVVQEIECGNKNVLVQKKLVT